MKEFYSVLKASETFLEIEKSKFIAYVQPVETEMEAMNFINKIKKQHNNATHNVSAFYVRDNYFCKRYSDDGEPTGTAGMPSLQTIVNKKIIDVCVVITRYFGGIKLGAGGLARAYADATNRGLENSEIICFEKMSKYCLTIGYDQINSVQYFLKKKEILIGETTYNEKISIEIFLSDDENEILTDIINLTSSKLSVILEKELYIAKKEGKIISRKDI